MPLCGSSGFIRYLEDYLFYEQPEYTKLSKYKLQYSQPQTKKYRCCFFHRIWCRWSRVILLSAHHPSLEIRCCSYIILIRQIVVLKGISLSISRNQLFAGARESRTIRLRGSLPFLHIVYASLCHALSRLSAESFTFDS